METAALEWWLKTGSIYGLGFVAIAGLLWLVFYTSLCVIRSVVKLIDDVRVKWLPKVIDGHAGFLETTRSATERTSKAVETTSVAVTKLADTTTVLTDNHGKTHRALSHITQAIQCGDICDEAKGHLEQARRELRAT